MVTVSPEEGSSGRLFGFLKIESGTDELLEGFLNTKLIDIILKVSNIDGNRYYKDLSNEEKLVLCKNLKGLKINITGTKGFDNSQICSGGVKLSEIDYNTFESKILVL